MATTATADDDEQQQQQQQQQQEKEDKEAKEQRQQQQEECCAVCMERLELMDRAMMTDCLHVMCAPCLADAMVASSEGLCPVCRQRVRKAVQMPFCYDMVHAAKKQRKKYTDADRARFDRLLEQRGGDANNNDASETPSFAFKYRAVSYRMVLVPSPHQLCAQLFHIPIDRLKLVRGGRVVAADTDVLPGQQYLLVGTSSALPAADRRRRLPSITTARLSSVFWTATDLVVLFFRTLVQPHDATAAAAADRVA